MYLMTIVKQLFKRPRYSQMCQVPLECLRADGEQNGFNNNLAFVGPGRFT